MLKSIKRFAVWMMLMATSNTKSFTWFNTKITFSHGRELFVSHCQGATLTANFESILRLSWDQLKSQICFVTHLFSTSLVKKNLSMFYSLVKGFELYINMSMPLKVFSRKVCLRIGKNIKSFCKPCDGIYSYIRVTYDWRPNRNTITFFILQCIGNRNI